MGKRQDIVTAMPQRVRRTCYWAIDTEMDMAGGGGSQDQARVKESKVCLQARLDTCGFGQGYAALTNGVLPGLGRAIGALGTKCGGCLLGCELDSIDK